MGISPTRRAVVALAAVTSAGLAVTAVPASAVNVDQGNAVVSANPANWTPHVMNGSVNAITQLGDEIVAAGTFTTVRQTLTGPDITRNHIFSFNATTGQIDMGFDPNLGGAANSLDTDGTSLYVGGAFTSVDGNTAVKKVAKLSADGSVEASLKAVPNGAVNEVVVRGGRLFVGGAFTSIKNGKSSYARGALAALDTGTGAVLPSVDVPFTGVYDPNNMYQGKAGGTTNVKRFDVTSDGSKLVAIGNFSTVGGQPHSQVAVLNTPTGGNATVANWATSRFDRASNSCAAVFDTFTRDLDISPDGSYFVVSATGAFAGGAGSGTMCDSTSRWELTGSGSGQQPTWIDYTGGDTTYGVAVTGSAVYVGGHMRWENNPFQGDQAGPGAVSRAGIAALDPVNGLPLSWNPTRTRGVGAQALFATRQGLWVGSDTTRIAKENHYRIALMPLAGGTSVPTVANATLPNDLFVAQGTGQGALVRRPVGADGSPTGTASTVNTGMSWSQVRGAFYLNGTVFYGLSDGALYARTFDAGTGALGAQRKVNLNDDPDTGQRIPFTIASLSGMFYDPGTHRIYYTLKNDRNLYYRFFTPESEVVGAQTFTGTTSVDLSRVAGMTLAGGRVLYGSTDGTLRSVGFSGGRITGTASTLSSDGSWNAVAMFVPND